LGYEASFLGYKALFPALVNKAKVSSFLVSLPPFGCFYGLFTFIPSQDKLNAKAVERSVKTKRG